MKKPSLAKFSFLGLALISASAVIAAFAPSKTDPKKLVEIGSVTKPSPFVTDCTVTAGSVTVACETTANDSGSGTAGTTMVETVI